ncbi:hypothetical protein AB1303_13810 [Saccharolobus solfataricus]
MKIGVFEPIPGNLSIIGGGGVVLRNVLAILKKMRIYSPFVFSVY